MAEKARDDRKVVKPFAAQIRLIGEGRLHDELSKAMHDLVEEVMKHQKKGSLVLTLNFEVDTKMATPMLVITDNVVVKAPRLARPKTMTFVDQAGNLSADHPNMVPLLNERLQVVSNNPSGPLEVADRG